MALGVGRGAAGGGLTGGVCAVASAVRWDGWGTGLQGKETAEPLLPPLACLLCFQSATGVPAVSASLLQLAPFLPPALPLAAVFPVGNQGIPGYTERCVQPAPLPRPARAAPPRSALPPQGIATGG